MKFLYTDNDTGEPFRPTRCWVAAEGLENKPDQWSFHLDEPTGRPAGSVVRVDDLKRWILFGEKQDRYLYLGSTARGQTLLRVYGSQEVFGRYLSSILGRVRAGSEDRRPVWVLMPSIGDEGRRKRYLEAIQAAAPEASTLFEPEMVLEYFRLVTRELALEKRRTGIYLVIDVGAATCNMTFVLTRKDATTVDATTARQRPERLRPVRGDSSELGGRWVDEQLVRDLKLTSSTDDGASRQGMLDLMEAAKRAVSESKEPVALTSPPCPAGLELTPDHLRKASKRLWHELAPLYRNLANRLYGQLTKSEYAKEQITPHLERHGVTSGEQIHRIIDGIILAGGTSQLVGFEEAMHSAIYGKEVVSCDIFRVGSAYAIAAALGGLAHVLHQQHQPRRLHGPGRVDVKAPESDFLSTMPADVVFEWRVRGAKANSVTVVERNEEFADVGGLRLIPTPPFRKDDELTAGLLPSKDGGRVDRTEYPRRDLTVRRAPGSMEVLWDPDERIARVKSMQVQNTDALFLDMKGVRVASQPVAHPMAERTVPEGCVGFDEASDIIIDLGMSKTVVVTAQAGTLPIKAFQHEGPRVFRRLEGEPTGGNIVTSDSTSIDAGPRYGSEQRKEPPLILPEADAGPPLVDGRPWAEADLDAQPSSEEVEAAAEPPEAPQPATPITPARRGRAPNKPFIGQLFEAMDHASSVGEPVERGNLTMLLLGLAVRPFVLLAGPPGCGKTTLVRTASQLLGTVGERTFHEIAVQAHWTNDKTIYGSKGLVPKLKELRGDRHLVLFDEVNLTRPEYYLAKFFKDLPVSSRPAEWPTELYACGTLNIDDTSRPPSPKVLDRCFLIELDAPELDLSSVRVRPLGVDPKEPVTLSGLPSLPDSKPSSEAWEQVASVTRTMTETVRKDHLREDLLPSRRVLEDVAGFISLYESLGSDAAELISASEVLDRLLASRILTKLSGAADQVGPVIAALKKLGLNDLPRCRRRIELASKQMTMGFVSPWQ